MIYFSLFCCLLLTSLLFHYTKNELFLLFFILLCLIMVIYGYIYGYLVKQYCLCNNKYACDVCHSILHMIVSIGHNCIIYLM